VYLSSEEQLWTHEASSRFNQLWRQKCCWVWWVGRLHRNALRKRLLWFTQLRRALLYLKLGGKNPVDC